MIDYQKKIINGKEISDKILDDIKYNLTHRYDYFKGKECTLAIITIGNDLASKVYVNNKKKACEKTGIKCLHKTFTSEDTFYNICQDIRSLNNNDNISGIIIQLPIISNILTQKEIKYLTSNFICEEKDVDGFLPNSKFTPCTPKGIIRLLDSIPNFTYEGKIALIIGRSEIVGKPIAKLLLDKNCTVIQAHSKTPKERLLRLFSFSDIVVSAVGKNNIITEDDAYQYFKDNRHDFYGDFKNHNDSRVIIDVGINRDKETGKLCGDFSETFKQEYSKYYTPVPGGVGPMTVAMLLENTWESFSIEREEKF